MGLIETLRDDFTGTTILKQWSGNGSISLPGTVGRLTCPNGQNCNWDYSTTGAPLLFDNVRQLMTQPAMPFFIETKLSLFTGTTNYRLAGLIWGTTKALGLGVNFYAYYLAYYKQEGRLIVDYQYPTGGVRLFNSVGIVDPASAPHWYRIYWNPYNRPVWIQELSLALGTDQLCFAYSVDGTNWTSMGTRTSDFAPVIAGIHCRKWETSAVNAEADFDYFAVEQYNEADLLLVPSVGKDNQETLALEDQGGIITESGPTRFDSTGVGEAMSIAPPSMVAFEDQGQLLGDGQGSRFDLPEISEAISVRETMALEDGFQCHLNDSDYIKGLNDGDGREFIGYTSIRQVLLYDATQDPWHTHGAGHYGAGRDGKLYYDGVECGPGAFSVGSPAALNDTAWTRPGGLVDRFSSAHAPELTYPVAGTVRFAPSGTGAQLAAVSTALRWYLVGDFDVQIDFNVISAGSAGTDGGLEMQALLDPNNVFYVRRKLWGGNFYDKDVRNNGSWVSYASVSTSNMSGKLRLTRVGSQVRSYYWSGSAWVQIGSTYTMTYNRPVFLSIGYYCQNTPSGVDFELSNFTINSGTTTNLIGWAREAAGTYRGSQAEFPEHALISSSGQGFDIIDVDTQKLWMSFRGATGNLVAGDANYYIRQLAMKDGVLFVAFRTFDAHGVVNGWAAWIDFTLDFMRLHRGPTYNDAGLIYNVELTTGVWPRDSANGCIAFRNNARGFYAAYTLNWRFQNDRANWCDLLHDGDHQYRAVANNGGAYVARWRRWRFEGTNEAHLNTPDSGLSTVTTAVQWIGFAPTTKDLVYHDRTKVYIVTWSNLSTILSGGGGTWTEDNEYTLAGTVSAYDLVKEAQDKMLFYGGYLWYARVQGVYRMDMGTGASTLFYGKVGSGATHEVLPDYSTIVSLHLGADGVTPVLLVGLTYPDRVVAVNLASHVIYWRGRELDSRTPVALAIGD